MTWQADVQYEPGSRTTTVYLWRRTRIPGQEGNRDYATGIDAFGNLTVEQVAPGVHGMPLLVFNDTDVVEVLAEALAEHALPREGETGDAVQRYSPEDEVRVLRDALAHERARVDHVLGMTGAQARWDDPAGDVREAMKRIAGVDR